MPTIQDYLNKLPPESREALRLVWNAMSPSDRSSFLDLINTLPINAPMVRSLLKLTSTHFRIVSGKKSKVAIVGPANVGKSTLYNQFVFEALHRAEVGPLPGTTKINQHADTGLFNLVDTPGADAVGVVGQQERAEALNAAAQADFLIIMFDAIQGIKQTELDLFHELRALNKPYIVVLNKIDLVKKQKQDVIDKAASNLGLTNEQVVPVVAKSGEGLNNILTAIAGTEPELVAALGHSLPQYRWQLAWKSITGAASAAAVIALTPLPILDFGPLVVLQGAMVLGIARIYDYDITPVRARELIATFGLGMLGRRLFMELSKLGGIPGWALSAAIASSMTMVMGYSAVMWFERGQKISGKTMSQMTKAITGFLLENIKSLGKQRPSKKTLKEHMSTAMAELPMGQDRTILDEQANRSAATPDEK